MGFYSAFMVADQVEVFTKSALPDSEGLCWKSSGDGRYTISAAPEAERGTRIVLHLKASSTPFYFAIFCVCLRPGGRLS